MTQTFLPVKNTMKHSVQLRERGFSLVFVLVFANLLFCQQIFSQTVVTNPASPWTVPAGVTTIKAEVWGTGGSGGGGSTGFFESNKGGGGGGGGAYKLGNLVVTGGQSITGTIGTQGSTGTGAGGAGGATTFGTVTANGGSGGSPNNGAGGAGGTGGTFNGGAGGTGVSGAGAGGGGAAGNNAAGGAGTSAAAGTGGVGSPNSSPYIGGNGGGIQTSTNTNGLAGNVPGGGGGGGRVPGTLGSANGGVGGLGRIVITYTCSVYSLTNPTTASSQVCAGSTSQINLSSSAAGLPTGVYTVTYNQSAPNLATGVTVSMTVTTAGSGSFATATLANAGNTTITITNLQSGSGTGCSNAISVNNTATVAVNALPTVYTLTGGGAYCSDGNGVTLNLSGSQAGVNYIIARNGSPVTTIPGTGAALSVPNVTTAGTYTVSAVNATTACSANMTGSAVVSINPSPVITAVVASPATLCLGSTSTITATPVFTAATVALGSGTSTTTGNASNSNTLGPNPFEDWYGGSKQHMLITVAELNAMGLTAGSQISALQIQLAAANTGYALLNYTVKIQHTALAALTTTFTTAGFTTVFGPASYTPSGTGFNNIGFTTNFTWNGTSNLLIETNYSNNNTGSSGTTTAVFGTTGFVSTAFYRADNVSAATVTARTTADYVYSARNNIKLTATVPPAITWSPVTQLFSNAGATTAYTAGQNLRVVYAKPTVTRTYTATATNGVGCTATQNVTVTVNNPPVIGTQPVNQAICENGSVSFSTVASGTGISYQWRKGTVNLVNGGNISGATSATLTINPTATGDAAANYNVVVSGTAPCTPVTSNNVSLTVNTAPGLVCPGNVVINADPGVCQATRTFSAVASGSPAPTVSYIVSGNFISFPYAFPVGTTIVDVLAEGACAPDATCSFSVTVNDLVSPAPDVAQLSNATGECSVTVSAAPTATDICDGPLTGTTTDPLTYTVQGTYTINWTFTDSKGNTSAQTQTVIVDDITAPVADVTNLPNATGECAVTVSAVPAATDNCVGAVNGTTIDPLTYNTQGTYTITWRYNDGNGNISTQTQTVIVDDITAPVADVTSLPTETGECSVTVTAPTATDNCVGSITGTTTDPTTYTAAGNYGITWSYNDGNGNVFTQSQAVVVTDVNAPVPDITNLQNVTAECSVTVVAPTATDACVGTITGTTTDPVTYTAQGTYTITWSYNDGSGNVSTQTQTAIVDDITAPVADISNLPNATGECSVTVSAPAATDNCVGAVTATTTDPVTYSTQGTYTINWTYDDGNGNTSSQTQTVVVDDVTPPVADVATLSTVTGECSATVSVAPTATDNCVGSVTGTTTDPLTYNTQGTFTITWSYDDGNGNTSTQTQTVIVDDITAPVADVATLPTVTGECAATATNVPTATDNCAGSVTGTTTDPLTYNTQGTFTIIWSYNDGNGNTSTQTQTVVVDDVTAPVADVASLPDATGECSVTVTAPTATDNCVGSVTGTTSDPTTYSTAGSYGITWTYNDGNGNSSTQTQNVTVTDVNAPVADVASLPTVTGECTAGVTAPTATDACVGLVTGTTTDPLSYNTQGTFTITWSYNDGNGNISSQTQTVVVDDVTAPVANLATLPTVTGECSASLTAPAATDNCVGSVTATTTDPLTYNTQGTYTVNWSYDDGNGNVSTQVQTVIVDDITAPVADITTLPNVTGECSVIVSAVPTATDNCVGAVNGITTDPLTYNAQGTYSITWTYNDGNGNSSTQVQTVIVNDVTAPVISCPFAQKFCSVPGNNYVIPVLAASDNCGVATVSYAVSGATTRSGSGNNASGLFNIGVSAIVWTVTDINNNSSSCSTTVSINIAPATPGTISGPTNACPYIGTGEQVTYSIEPLAFATGYLWTVPSTVTIVSGQGTSNLTVTINSGFNASTNPVTRLLRVRSLSDCGNSADKLLYLLAQFPSTPGPISGPTDVCALIGTTNTATYTINKVIAATSYAWTTQAANTTVTHPNGPGANDTVIVVTFGAGFTSSPITVAAVNSCGTSGSVRSLVIPRTSAPTPGLISGPTNVCANILPLGTVATYTIAAIAGATSYTWNAPLNSVVTHPNGAGANDYTITVQFPAGFSSGTISVSASNGCGTSVMRSLNVTKLNPATPGVIDVIEIQSCPNRVYSYTISGVPANSTSLVWTIPTSQGAVLQGQTATSITVSYPATAVSGSVTVQSVNNCGTSTTRSTAVRLPACPPEGFTKTGTQKSTQPATLAVAGPVIKVFPNPSIADFKLQVLTAGKEKVMLRILDIQGREFKKLTVIPYQQISIGNDLKAGSYILEIIQGNFRKTEKLLKF